MKPQRRMSLRTIKANEASWKGCVGGMGIHVARGGKGRWARCGRGAQCRVGCKVRGASKRKGQVAREGEWRGVQSQERG